VSGARYIVGDVFDVLATLEDGSVDLILTSPPFLALRSYLPADHPDKAKEIGSEPTPEAFIDMLLDLTEEWARVLAPHGSLCVELGDTYSGSGGAGGDYNADGLRDGQEKFDGSARRNRPTRGIPGVMSPGGTMGGGNGQERRGDGWPLAKSLCLIPESYRWALVYGRNPFNGRQTPAWRARNVVRWCRPNPPVGALGDKFRPATSDMVVACKSAKRWFDLDAVRHENTRSDETGGGQKRERARFDAGLSSGTNIGVGLSQNPAGAPPLDHWWHDDQFEQDSWLISTEAFRGSHYATWPRDLCVTPIESMCPRRVCRTCGKPSERITAKTDDYEAFRNSRSHAAADHTEHTNARHIAAKGGVGSLDNRETGSNAARGQLYQTLGWSDCSHDDWRPGLVLDPFAGSGTTLQVATGHGRDAIGIDLDPRNAWLARERCGMFLTIHETPATIDIPTGEHL
jgi:hypothetical protein